MGRLHTKLTRESNMLCEWMRRTKKSIFVRQSFPVKEFPNAVPYFSSKEIRHVHT